MIQTPTYIYSNSCFLFDVLIMSSTFVNDPLCVPLQTSLWRSVKVLCIYFPVSPVIFSIYLIIYLIYLRDYLPSFIRIRAVLVKLLKISWCYIYYQFWSGLVWLLCIFKRYAFYIMMVLSIVCIGVSTPTTSSKTPPSSFLSNPLKSANCPSTLFGHPLPIFWFFVPSPLKIRFFREPHKGPVRRLIIR